MVVGVLVLILAALVDLLVPLESNYGLGEWQSQGASIYYSQGPIQYKICLLFIFKTILLAMTPTYPYLSNQIAAPAPLFWSPTGQFGSARVGLLRDGGRKIVTPLACLSLLGPREG